MRPDLSVFVEANKTKGKKRSWEARRKLIEDRFPSVATLDWKKAFDRDMDLFADILRDILKADAAAPGRSGPKPAVDYRQGVTRFRQLVDEDYSMLPFDEALASLQGSLSVSGLAHKVGLSRPTVYRLLTGAKHPSLEEMELIARAFKKAPSYFHAYRVSALAAALAQRLDEIPEASVNWYMKMSKADAA